MPPKIDSKYDVIIIGAGIGGLVCGCYLAKAGMKVLIVEQHYKAGGYCSSFKRGGYTFDVGVHYIGAARYDGEISKIIEQLDLDDKIEFLRFDPCDKILLPSHTIFVRKDYRDTIEDFKKQFPEDKKRIDGFFNLIMKKHFFYLYGKLKNASFKNLLDDFFEDDKIKGAIGTLLGNIGLPPSRVSALTAVFLYREFILDPGYYPRGGMQVFSNQLASRFTDFGGTLALSTKATKIMVKNKKVFGVNVNKQLIKSDYVVSNVDATQTFLELVSEPENSVAYKITAMEPSISAFAIYVGLKTDLSKVLKDRCAIWNFFTYDIERCYGNPEHNITAKKMDYFVCTFPSMHDVSLASPGKSTMGIFICAPYKDEVFWNRFKIPLTDRLIDSVVKLIPEIKDGIDVKVIATPYTFYKYTLNRNGAIYGWASTPTQIDRTLFPQDTDIEGLFLAGHWCTNGLGQGGISEVAYTGRRAAKLIMKDFTKKKELSSVLL